MLLYSVLHLTGVKQAGKMAKFSTSRPFRSMNQTISPAGQPVSRPSGNLF